LGKKAVVIPGATNWLTDVTLKHLVPRWVVPKLLAPITRRAFVAR
jgi:hypothetical protein